MKLTKGLAIMFIVMSLGMTVRTARAEISITVAGTWYETIDKTHLTSGAGSDLQSEMASGPGQVLLDVSGTNGPWRIDIKKNDSTWSSSLHLHVRRTSDGNGGSVRGGTAFQEVSGINTPFFSGSGSVSDIKVQLKINGVSIQIPPAAYATMFYYTVTEL